MSKKFRITINAFSEDELEKRINDNLKRGFVLVKKLEPELKAFTRYHQETNRYAKQVKEGFSSGIKLTAIMERDN